VQPSALERLREKTRLSPYTNRLFLVGGYVRDKLLEKQSDLSDLDLVLEGDALEAAAWLWNQRIADHPPVLFPNFGTAMIHVDDAQVELVTARAETYRQGSRKPIVTPGTLATDAQRRDFTVNTFLENLHTGEIIDPLGCGFSDLAAKILRTPLDATITFTDDPLRMLRACRFAAKLGFALAPETEAALHANSFRLSAAHGISFERIRDELNKTLLAKNPAAGLEKMRETGLLEQFSPELAALAQNSGDILDAWAHTLITIERLPESAPLSTRLAMLFHERLGAEVTQQVLLRLRYSIDEVKHVVTLVDQHLCYDGYNASWTDAVVRRLIRSVGEYRQELFVMARADSPDYRTELTELETRMERFEAELGITKLESPLSGVELMALLQLPAGRQIGVLKAVLTDAVVSGELAPDDKAGALKLAQSIISDRATISA
jgi:poly(A) polymerase